MQGRFKHMDREDVEALQAWLCRKWRMRYAPSQPPLDRTDDLACDGDGCEGA